MARDAKNFTGQKLGRCVSISRGTRQLRFRFFYYKARNQHPEVSKAAPGRYVRSSNRFSAKISTAAVAIFMRFRCYNSIIGWQESGNDRRSTLDLESFLYVPSQKMQLRHHISLTWRTSQAVSTSHNRWRSYESSNNVLLLLSNTIDLLLSLLLTTKDEFSD